MELRSSLAWLFSVTIIGLPLGLFIINNLPMILLLQPPGLQQVTRNTPTGSYIEESGLPQYNFFLRALYFVLVGWWWSFIWTVLAYVVCLTIIGLPLGMLMFSLLPKRPRWWVLALLHILLTSSFAAVWYKVLNGYDFMTHRGSASPPGESGGASGNRQTDPGDIAHAPSLE